MDTTYCHIEEFGDDRYNLLPIMAYCFNHSVIWAPNMEKLDAAYKAGRSFFSAGDILELIENRNIQVIARAPWYDKVERLEPNRFQAPGWLEGVDNKLRDYAIADRDKPTVQKRVIIAPDEHGITFANRIMGSNKKKDIDFIDFIRKQKENGNLPQRIIKRLDYERFDEDESIRFILRSVYNNNDAFKLSHAEIPTVSDRPDIFLKCMEYDGLKYQYADKKPSPEQISAIMESLKFIMSLNKDSLTPRKFKRLIETGVRPRFIVDDFRRLSELTNIEVTTNEMLNVILSFVRNDMQLYKKYDYFGLSDKAGLAGVFFGLITFSLSSIMQSFISLGLSVFSSPTSARRALGIPSETSISLPYLFAFGTDKPRYSKMEALYNMINEERSK